MYLTDIMYSVLACTFFLFYLLIDIYYLLILFAIADPMDLLFVSNAFKVIILIDVCL